MSDKKNNAYEMTGAIKAIMEPQTFASGFTKREFVIISDDEYPQDVKFTCVKDKCAMLDILATGDVVEVKFNIRGNEYKERFFVDLQAWKVTKVGGAKSDTKPAQSTESGTREVDAPPADDSTCPF